MTYNNSVILHNTLTGNRISVDNPEEFFGLSNRTSDGKAIFEVILRASQMSKLMAFKAQGFRTAWSGNGQICLVAPKVEAAL